MQKNRPSYALKMNMLEIYRITVYEKPTPPVPNDIPHFEKKGGNVLCGACMNYLHK